MLSKSSLKSSIKYTLIASLIFLTGCGLWEDFTTYFNLYYNTKDIFNKAEQDVKNQNQGLFLPDDKFEVPSDAKQLFNKVIAKCSEILQYDPTSAYVDDALLMLGKSFYYLRNYEKAQRKFQELIATQKTSDLLLQDKLWLGRTQIKLKDYDDALTTLDDVRKEGLAGGQDEVVNQAYIEEIKFYINKEDYSGAINFATEFLKHSNDDEVNAEVESEVGTLYVKLNDDENAIRAFNKVFDYSPSFDVELNTRLALGEALRDGGHPKQALELFSKMRNEDKFSDSDDQISMEIGLTQMALNDYDGALNTLMYADTTYKSSKNIGMLRYVTGELYENDLHNYDSALVYYNLVVKSPISEEYLQKTKDKIRVLNRFVDLRQNLDMYSKQLSYLLDPKTFSRDSANYYGQLQQEMIARSQEQQQSLFATGREKLIEQRQDEINSMIRAKGTLNMPAPIRPTISADSLRNLIGKYDFQLGNIFFTELNVPDSAYKYYTIVLKDYPNPAYQPKVLFALGSYYETINENRKADSLYNVVYNNYKNDRVANAAAQKLNKPLLDVDFDPAQVLYASAEQKMDSAKYDTSIRDFYNIYKKHPHSDYAPKALYAAGWILENKLNLNDSAAAVYDSIYNKYPRTVYAQEVSTMLNYYNQEMAKKKLAIKDSLAKVQAELKKSEKETAKKDSLGTNKNLPQGQNAKGNLENNEALKDTSKNAIRQDNSITKPKFKTR